MLQKFVNRARELEFLIRLKSTSETPLRIGKWWHKDKEIDLLVLNEKACLFFEVKWRELKMRECRKVLEKLMEKSAYVEWHGEEKRYGIIAKHVGTDDKKELRSQGYLIYDLEDFEALMK